MGVKKTEMAKEDTWQYAPKLDPFGLRLKHLRRYIQSRIISRECKHWIDR